MLAVDALPILFGVIVGFALGLTGGGGSIFAVPLLVYGSGVPAQEAVGISLAAVGSTALVGFIQRWRAGEVETGTGILFAVAGMLGAPVGTWLGGFLGVWLLPLFAVLMCIVATRMWLGAVRRPKEMNAVRAISGEGKQEDGATCRRDPEGRLRITSRCAALLVFVGFLTGVLAGLFGVGGGFVIVPALVLFSGMGIHRAVATSLLVISLVSVSGVASFVIAGRQLDWWLTGLFILGGAGGMTLGTLLARRISGPNLQKVFATAIILVAVFVLGKSLA